MNPLALMTDGLVKGVMDGLDNLFTSDEERAEAELKIRSLMMQPHIIQAMTTLKEAEHPNWFVSGWRPAIGWVCAAGIGWAFVLRPILQWLIYSVALVAVDADAAKVAKEIADGMPEIDTGPMSAMIVTLLGLGGVRMAEKMKGVARG